MKLFGIEAINTVEKAFFFRDRERPVPVLSNAVPVPRRSKASNVLKRP